ncbi:hypothetical protein WM16_21660 [Burkholderia ubonensis]|uniref:Uncharacterized protein n=1 Tax=Burkholderia ubonensis TaxID=101571 RepID=A0A108C8C7_9BURK|nr:hypothetical protein WM16_21660 [Burkholderia ubonensis]
MQRDDTAQVVFDDAQRHANGVGIVARRPGSMHVANVVGGTKFARKARRIQKQLTFSDRM